MLLFEVIKGAVTQASYITTLVKRYFIKAINSTHGHTPFSDNKGPTKVGIVRLSTIALTAKLLLLEIQSIVVRELINMIL